MKVAVIAGDGIGPEVVAQSLRVLEALRDDGLDLELTQALAGAAAYRIYGQALPEATLSLARESDANVASLSLLKAELVSGLDVLIVRELGPREHLGHGRRNRPIVGLSPENYRNE